MEHAEDFKEKNPLHAANTNTESNVIVISDDEDDDDEKGLNELGKPTKRVKKSDDYTERNTNNQQQRVSPIDIPRNHQFNSMMQNPSFYINHNPMLGGYPFNNYNFGLNLPNFLPFNQSFPSILPTLQQLPNFGCLAPPPQPMPTNQLHYGVLPRRSNYALINND